MKSWLFPLWIIIDVLLFIAVTALWITAPEYKTLNIGLTVFALSLGLLLAFIRMEELKVLFKSSYFKTALVNVLNVFLVISIIGIVNYLGNKNLKEFDLTPQKRNSLTEQSYKIIEMIDSPLTMTIFSKREEWEGMLGVLKLYQAKNKNVKLKAVDTDVRPELVKAKNITQNGTVLIEYKGKESSFVITDELSVTNALLKALRDIAIKIYIVTGHQELSCAESSPEGLSVLCDQLKSQNYEVANLDLTQIKEVPKDASAVMIMGPISGFLPQEAKLLEAYLTRGGSMFLALAPAFKAEVYDNLTSLAKPFGLEMGKDIVVDRLSTVQGSEATIPIITKYDPTHPITAGFENRTVFPLSSSVRTIKGNDNATLLAFSTPFPGSWAETDLKGVTLGKAQFNEASDLKGPIGLMGVGERVGENAPRDSRFVLLGSSSFLVNAYQGQAGNTTLFLNAVSWLINDEGIISFNRPGIQEAPVILSSQHLQMIFVISIILVPVLFFGTAIFIYRRRREL